jgi:hypothetical protein
MFCIMVGHEIVEAVVVVELTDSTAQFNCASQIVHVGSPALTKIIDEYERTCLLSDFSNCVVRQRQIILTLVA